MVYELLFLTKMPAFLLIIEKTVWKKTSIRIRYDEEKLKAYLRTKTEWKQTTANIGFGKCGMIVVNRSRVRITFPISRRMLHHTMLSLSAILEELNPFHNRKEDMLTVRFFCGDRHPLFGEVSPEFRRRLALLSKMDEEAIREDMRCAYRAAAPIKMMAKYAEECRAQIDGAAGRFSLSCFGDACDVSIYPEYGDRYESPGHFTSHNLDASFQQASLLAGIASLYGRVKSAI